MPVAFGPIPKPAFIYQARPAGPNYDGDTAPLELRLGASVIRETSARLFGINCPELYLGIGSERHLNPPGEAARAATQQWLAAASAHGPWPLIVHSRGVDKYGNRLDLIIWRVYDKACLNQWLLDQGFAVVMKG